MRIAAWFGLTLALAQAPVSASPSAAGPRNPVLLVHGISDDSKSLAGLERHLRAAGREVHTLDLKPNRGEVGLEVLAAQVADYADSRFPAGKKFDLIGFSMGGLVTRYYVQRLGGVDRVDHFVTISAPHHGTFLARLARNSGCRQMRPGSAFLRGLEDDAEMLRALKFTCIYTPFDLVILPAQNSAMRQAQNVRIPILLHPLMVWQPCALRTIEAALRS